MELNITIRNLENHEVFHFNKFVWGLMYDPETIFFSCYDFRADEWRDNVCRRPLKRCSSLFPELDGDYVFPTYQDALYFYNWLGTEAHPAYERMCNAPG